MSNYLWSCGLNLRGCWHVTLCFPTTRAQVLSGEWDGASGTEAAAGRGALTRSTTRVQATTIEAVTPNTDTTVVLEEKETFR